MEAQKLTASDARVGDQFGFSTAISDDIAVAGAINADAGDRAAGAAYVFPQDAGQAGRWSEVQKLTASDAGVGDWFGISVAISGDTAVVGANREAGGVGAAYVFERDTGGVNNWGEVTKLTASDAQPGDWFGWSVALDGNTIVIGAEGERSQGAGAGAAYVFQRDRGGLDNWGEVAKLTASDARGGDEFGWSVAVHGSTAVVGAQDAASKDAGSNVDGGAAYVFQRDEGGANSWGEVAKLTASDASPGDWFGWSVAVTGDIAVVGAIRAAAAYVFQRDQGGADRWGDVAKLVVSGAHAGYSVAVSGDSAVVGTNGEGAYVFRRDEGGAANWGQVTKLRVSDDQSEGVLGRSVALSGLTSVVGGGSLLEDIEGDGAGAAYLFDRLGIKSTPTDVLSETQTPPAATVTPEPQATAHLLTGDASCDGVVNEVDAAVILQFTAGILAAPGCPDAADVNDDGSISSVDAALILQFGAGLVDVL